MGDKARRISVCVDKYVCVRPCKIASGTNSFNICQLALWKNSSGSSN